MIKKIIAILFLSTILVIPSLKAEEGMWLPLLLKKLNESDMQKLD
jgi:hypothetical protein